MTIARQQLTFEEYLMYDDGTDDRYEWVQGELIKLPPESEENNWIALNLRDVLIQFVSRRLVRPHTCELQVPVIQPTDPANRFPDLVVLREEHLSLTRRRLTITLDMPAPQLVAEVVSPGDKNRERDYQNKRAQYAKREIPEYWIVDPKHQSITVLSLKSQQYVEVGTYRGSDRVQSIVFPTLQLMAEEIFLAE